MAKRNRAKTTQDTLPITYIVDETSLSMTFEEAMAGLHPLIHLLARQAARDWMNQTSAERVAGNISNSQYRADDLQNET